MCPCVYARVSVCDCICVCVLCWWVSGWVLLCVSVSVSDSVISITEPDGLIFMKLLTICDLTNI